MKVTDKYNDPIEAAKAQAIAQYSAKKTSSVPTEIVDLPSEGRFYPKGHPLRSGKIEMRYMTAYDEDILSNMSYIRNGIVIDKLLESLIVTPGVSYDDILNCDKDTLLLSARILSYGKTYDVSVKSPSGKELKRSVDLTKLELTTSKLSTDENGIISYETDSVNAKVRLLTIKQQNEVQVSTKPLFEFLVQSIVEINGNTSKEQIKEYLQYNLLARDSKQLRKYIVDNLPSHASSYEFEDEDGGVFTAGFQIGPDFFY